MGTDLEDLKARVRRELERDRQRTGPRPQPAQFKLLKAENPGPELSLAERVKPLYRLPVLGYFLRILAAIVNSPRILANLKQHYATTTAEFARLGVMISDLRMAVEEGAHDLTEHVERATQMERDLDVLRQQVRQLERENVRASMKVALTEIGAGRLPARALVIGSNGAVVEALERTGIQVRSLAGSLAPLEGSRTSKKPSNDAVETFGMVVLGEPSDENSVQEHLGRFSDQISAEACLYALRRSSIGSMSVGARAMIRVGSAPFDQCFIRQVKSAGFEVTPEATELAPDLGASDQGESPSWILVGRKRPSSPTVRKRR